MTPLDFPLTALSGLDEVVADEVLRQYEEAPYPCSDDLVFADYWKVPSLAWIETLANLGRRLDEPGIRILIAGCGTGRESFSFAKRFPGAQIVGLDFSPRAIELAREFHQRRAEDYPQVEFQVGDLSDPALPAALGEPFDFISCHGVLTYIPPFAACFPVLRACLRPQGLCYVGVNGPMHDSIMIRGIFQRLGLDPSQQTNTTENRERLAALDRWRLAMMGRDERKAVQAGRITIDRVSEEPWPYLSSDIFCAHLNNLPMEEWVAPATAAGLHFLGSSAHFRYINALLNDDQLPAELQVLPEAELYRLAGIFAPVSFHQLLFSAAPPREPPWADPVELRRWRVWRNPHIDADAIRGLIEAGAVPVNVAKGLEDFTTGRILVGTRTAQLILAADGQRGLGELLDAVGLNNKSAPFWAERIRRLSVRCLLRLLPPEEFRHPGHHAEIRIRVL